MKFNVQNVNSINTNITFNFFKQYDSKILRKFKKHYFTVIKTDCGKIEIRNRLLDVSHRKIIDAIFKNGNIQEQEHSDVSVFFDLQDILKELCMQKKDEELLIEKIKQISDAAYYIRRYNYCIRILNFYERRDDNIFLVFSRQFLELEKFKFISLQNNYQIE